MTEPLKLLAVFPHPDDETFGLGSTLVRYSSEGLETHLVCATRGERGWFDSQGPDPGSEGVGRIREAELRCAAETLGIREVSFLDFIDGDVDQAAPGEIIAKVVSHVRRIKPQVVVTFGPDGNYGHPDHVALSQFASAALVCAADGEYRDSERRTSHRVSKLYYMVDSTDLVGAANEAFGGISIHVDGVTRHHVGWEDWQITARLDNLAHMAPVQKAIRCHKSQLPGYGPIADWSLEKLGTVFGIANFYRAYSLVNGGRKVENDLFEGIR
jgi:LmbE family N-acetylglucosaminyl deacetylase